MSTSRQDCRIGKKRKPEQAATPPERSNFAHTCNLLSQYVKGKGGLRDLNLAAPEISGLLEATVKSEGATMNLLSTMEVSARSVDISDSKCTSRKDATVREPESTQMTIFYGGKVLVFDDFPANKIKDIMLLAGNGSPSTADVMPHANVSSSAAQSEGPQQLPDVAPSELPIARRSSLHRFLEKRKDKLPILLDCNENPSTADATPPANGNSSAAHLEGPQRLPDAAATELPIARRSSLHRFLEKRKDRAVARGPQQQHLVQNLPSPSSSKNDEQLELKL